VDMVTICAALQAELAELDAIVSALDAVGWNTQTPAEGWLVRDQIAHIGGTDRIATIAAGEPERFQNDILTQDRSTRAARQHQEAAHLSSAELLNWWRSGREAMLQVFLPLDPKTRIPWFGPAMSAVSFATARLMETWAHGQDIVDALGLQRDATERLQHVAHIGVRARPFSYSVHQKDMPEEDIRVELVSPAGNLWTWGAAQVANRISGAALDFCLVVTQRRHTADTRLRIEGEVAAEWMSIAQAFAGPAGIGRQPGQFPKSSGGVSG
jgi:uncharacterized protein (TIGR03084 family)